MFDTALLHSKIVESPLEFLRELFGDEVKPAGTDQWRVGRRGSLAIRLQDNVLLYYSHEDGQGGDAVSLWQRQRGGSLGNALQACAAWAHLPDASGMARPNRPVRSTVRPRPQEPAPAAPPRLMTDAQFAEAHVMIHRLGTDEAVRERIALDYAYCGWTPGLLRDLAGDAALGWHDGRIAFIYEDGIKLRWDENGRRRIVHHCGAVRSLWRGWMIEPRHTRVFVCEGETDAITMLADGWEQDPAERVVALPSADGIPADIGQRLAGREVCIISDHDPAGARSARKLIAALSGKAANIKQWRTPDE